MKFVVNLAWREMRASWHRLLFFFLCIAVGVGSIVSLRSLVQNVKASIGREARSLLTADVQASSNAVWNAEAKAALERICQSPIAQGCAQTLETTTMLRPLGGINPTPKMIELKAVQPQFPLYGEMVLAGGLKYSHDLLRDRGALVRQSLLTALGLKIGDQVKIGNLDFTIRGVIESEPGNTMNAFSIGPRVMVDHDDAVAAGLAGWGSRARHRALFKTREGEMEKLQDQLRRELRMQPQLSVRTFRYSQDRMTESLSQVEDYLSLIGLIILVLGGIGISSVTRVFIQQKMKTIAILKCLGGKNSRVLGAYLAQVLSLGLLGSLMGLLLAKTLTTLLPKFFADQLPFNVEFGMTWQAALQGLGVGLLITLLFSLVPLLTIRQIKPILVLRSLTDTGKTRFDWVKIVAGVFVLAGLIAVASWQAGSFRVGGIFLAGLAAMTLVLNLAATVLMKFVRGLRRVPSFTLRQGINSLYRPGNQTRTILMAVGLGVFFVVAVRSLQINLRSEFAIDLNALRADMYLIDVQRDQRHTTEEIIAKHTGVKPQLIPTVRARIAKINNGEVNSARPQTDQGANGNRDSNGNRGSGNQSAGRGPADNRGMMGREYVLTYRDYVEDFEKITAGRFWDSTPSKEPEVSIEELLHNELGLNVGDTMVFDVQGRRITARVTSIRRVDWRNARTGFLIVFRPGVLEQAPTMYIGAIKGPADSVARAQMQRDIIDKYPNVSVVDVRDIIEVARGIVQNITLAVSFVGGFVFLSGLLILIGSIAMTKYHRLYESAILKTLGARKKLIVATLLVEYGALGLLAGLIGSSAAIALTWAISEHALKINWQFIPSVNFTGVAVSLLLVMLVGVLSSLDVMIKKPLGILRSE